ncbi:MAG: hypothetical protein LBJ96_01545, partial [Holosporaceae bacterium]|nr:hypothetical protein [Holosporaceae bacterium]
MKKDVVSFVFSIAALSVSSSCFGMATERFFAAYNAHRTELLDAMSSGPGKSFVRIMDAEQAKYKASNEALALRVLNFFSKDRNHSGFLFGTTLYVFMMAYDLNILADGEIPAD